MHRRRIIWLALLVAVAVASIVVYTSSIRRARYGRIIIENDSSDAGVTNVAKVQARFGYDPYFDRVNYHGAIVFQTNAVAHSR